MSVSAELHLWHLAGRQLRGGRRAGGVAPQPLNASARALGPHHAVTVVHRHNQLLEEPARLLLSQTLPRRRVPATGAARGMAAGARQEGPAVPRHARPSQHARTHIHTTTTTHPAQHLNRSPPGAYSMLSTRWLSVKKTWRGSRVWRVCAGVREGAAGAVGRQWWRGQQQPAAAMTESSGSGGSRKQRLCRSPAARPARARLSQADDVRVVEAHVVHDLPLYILGDLRRRAAKNAEFPLETRPGAAGASQRAGKCVAVPRGLLLRRPACRPRSMNLRATSSPVRVSSARTTQPNMPQLHRAPVGRSVRRGRGVNRENTDSIPLRSSSAAAAAAAVTSARDCAHAIWRSVRYRCPMSTSFGIRLQLTAGGCSCCSSDCCADSSMAGLRVTDAVGAGRGEWPTRVEGFPTCLLLMRCQVATRGR